uniref:Uncharacterized protein n=1 Tax=Myoviridae sp. ctqMr7 TaxID=2823552 RepID=A0A8S5LH75_9CAUD|nr:MAG TPA: hypothetical protein [Myoviridae sp. ctqMr7]DAP29660.1 MAG TPA: hypothetical protein [Caudoviricetes sp.]
MKKSNNCSLNKFAKNCIIFCDILHNLPFIFL